MIELDREQTLVLINQYACNETQAKFLILLRTLVSTRVIQQLLFYYQMLNSASPRFVVASTTTLILQARLSLSSEPCSFRTKVLRLCLLRCWTTTQILQELSIFTWKKTPNPTLISDSTTSSTWQPSTSSRILALQAVRQRQRSLQENKTVRAVQTSLRTLITEPRSIYWKIHNSESLNRSCRVLAAPRSTTWRRQVRCSLCIGRTSRCII